MRRTSATTATGPDTGPVNAESPQWGLLQEKEDLTIDLPPDLLLLLEDQERDLQLWDTKKEETVSSSHPDPRLLKERILWLKSRDPSLQAENLAALGPIDFNHLLIIFLYYGKQIRVLNGVEWWYN